MRRCKGVAKAVQHCVGAEHSGGTKARSPKNRLHRRTLQARLTAGQTDKGCRVASLCRLLPPYRL